MMVHHMDDLSTVRDLQRQAEAVARLAAAATKDGDAALVLAALEETIAHQGSLLEQVLRACKREGGGA